MKKFTPTWLYIKCHNQTGLRYFGKTIRDPKKYLGSGRYWRRHLAVHGTDIDTAWCELFTNENDLVEFAEFFSKEFDIVKAVNNIGKKIWANEVPENGLHGGQNAGMPSPLKGKPTNRPCVWKGKLRPEHSLAMKGRKQSIEHIKNRAESLKNYTKTDTHCANISKAKKGVPNLRYHLHLKADQDLIKESD